MNAQNYKKLKEAGLVELVKKEDGTVVKITKSYHPFNKDEFVIASEETVTLSDIDTRLANVVADAEELKLKITKDAENEVEDLKKLKKDFNSL